MQLDLQGIYDEFSQAIMQFDAPSDIDTFHDVFYSPDWAFVDAAGVHHPWTEMREEAVKALGDCGAELALAHHHGTFQLTDEAIDAPVRALTNALAQANIAPERFRVLKPGQVLELDD